MIFDLPDNKNGLFFLSLSVCTFISLLIITISGLNLLSLLIVEIELKWKLLVILPLAFIFVLFFLKKLDLVKNLSRLLIFAFIIVIFSVYVGTLFPDTSWDGTAYHSDAILCLVEGKSIFSSCPEIDNHSTLHSKNFPASGWGITSVFVSITGIIESSHAIGFIWLIIFLILSVNIAIKLKLGLINTIIFTTVVIFNPVLIYQLWTNYNDSLVYMVSMCSIYSYILIIDNNYKIKQLGVILLSSTAIFLINLKFSSGVLVIFSFIVISLFILLLIRFNKLSPIRLKKQFLVYFLFFSLFVGTANSYHPYLTNIVQGEHIFYPIMGKNKSEWMETINGECLENSSRLVRAMKSPFARFDQKGGEECKKFVYSNIWSDKRNRNINATYKRFKTHYEKIANHDQGWRLAGFGPLFPFILIISSMIFLLNLFIGRSITETGKTQLGSEIKIGRMLLFFSIFISIVIQILITEPTWIVRYTPLFWTFPLLALLSVPFRYFKFTIILLIPLLLILVLHTYLLLITKISWERDGVLQEKQIEKFINEFEFNSVFSSHIFFNNFVKYKFGNHSLQSSENCFIKKFRYGTTDILFEIDMSSLSVHKDHFDSSKISFISLNKPCSKNGIGEYVNNEFKFDKSN